MKQLFLFVVLSSVLIFANAHGQSGAPQRCVRTHLKDAMELNRKRAPFYEHLSQGRSRGITKRLIAMEKKLLMSAPIGDWVGRFYQRKDIPVLCLDLIDMSETPAMRAFNPDGVDRDFLYSRPPVEQWNYQLELALIRSDYEKIVSLSDSYIQTLSEFPRYNCLLKHMLESIRRTASLAPLYKQAAKEKKVKSPGFVVQGFLRSHLDIMTESTEIDYLAAPLQAEGLPIICQDVPHIPAYSKPSI